MTGSDEAVAAGEGAAACDGDSCGSVAEGAEDAETEEGEEGARGEKTYEAECLCELFPGKDELQFADVFKVVLDVRLRLLVERRISQAWGDGGCDLRGMDIGWV